MAYTILIAMKEGLVKVYEWTGIGMDRYMNGQVYIYVWGNEVLFSAQILLENMAMVDDSQSNVYNYCNQSVLRKIVFNNGSIVSFDNGIDKVNF